MQFTAGATPLAIDHKLEGKIYNGNHYERAANPPGTVSLDPFDTHVIEPRHSWELPEGAEFIRKREMRGTA